MLYPVAPDKIPRFVERLKRACDADRIPLPSVKLLRRGPEEMVAAASPYVEGVAHDESTQGVPCVRINGRSYALVEVAWPEVVRDKEDQMVLYTGSVPCGPDPLAMWQVIRLMT